MRYKTYLIYKIIEQVLYDKNEAVVGVATNDMGVAKDGSKKETFQQGVELRGTSNELVLLLQIPPLKY